MAREEGTRRSEDAEGASERAAKRPPVATVHQFNSQTKSSEAKKLSITEVEITLPPLHGEGANFEEYMKHRHAYEQPLSDFYSSNTFRFKKHKWDAKRAKDEEYRRITDSLLRMVGGSIGARTEEDNKVIIGIIGIIGIGSGQVFVKYQAFLFAWDLSSIFYAKSTVYYNLFCSIVAFILTLHCVLVCGHAPRAILSSG